MTIKMTNRSITNLSRAVIKATEEASSRLVGAEVRLNTTRAGKYNQRKGRIEAVMPDAKDGLRVLVMVFKKGLHIHQRDRFLNSDTATRTYWPLNCVLFTGRFV